MDKCWIFASFVAFCLKFHISSTNASQINITDTIHQYENMLPQLFNSLNASQKNFQNTLHHSILTNILQQIIWETICSHRPVARMVGNNLECKPCKPSGEGAILLEKSATVDALMCSFTSYTGLTNVDNLSCAVTSLDEACSSESESFNHLIIQCPQLLVGSMMNTMLDTFDDITSEILLLILNDTVHFEMLFQVNVSGVKKLSVFHDINAITISGCRLSLKTIGKIMEQLDLSKVHELHLHLIEYPKSSPEQFTQMYFNKFQNISSLNISNYRREERYQDIPSEYFSVFQQVTHSNLANVNLTAIGWDNLLLSMPSLSHLTIGLESLDFITFSQIDYNHWLFNNFVKTAVPWNEIIKLYKFREVNVSVALPPIDHWDLSHLFLSNLCAFDFTTGFYTFPESKYILNISHNELNDLIICFDNVSLHTLDASHNQIKSLEKSIFNGIRNLKELQLSHNRIEYTNSSCFNKLSGLEILLLDHNEICRLSNDSFAGLDSLIELNLSHNKISNIPETLFTSLSHLNILHLRDNFIENVHFYPTSLKYIDLSSNPLKGDKGLTTRVHSKIFQALFSGTSSVNLSSAYSGHDYVKRKYRITVGNLNPSGSILETLLFYYLDEMLQGSSLHNFKQNVILHNTKMGHLGLDLYFSLFFDPEDILNHVNFDIGNNQLECGCKDIYTYFKINELYNDKDLHNKFYINNWICESPRLVKGVPFLKVPQRIFKFCTENLDNCPTNCACYKDIQKMDRVTVDCTGVYMTKLPTTVPDGTEVLLISESNLTTLCEPHKYLSNLTEIDVSGNGITEICDKFLTTLNNTKLNILNLRYNYLLSLPKGIQNLNNSMIFLTGNKFECDCENTWLKYWLLSSRPTLIPDTKSLLCKNVESTYFLEIDDTILSDLCTDNTVSWLGLAIGSTVALVVVLVIVFLMYKFWKSIKVWCFVKFNWHPFDQGDMDDNIENMDYDVFISYSHLDLTWVRENLMEFLHENGYSVCLHEKDWPVGVLITENILLSVKHSRRMIMVLSENYLSSEWCRVEFQAAHRAVLEGRTKYLIMIALEHVALKNLPAEIDFYVKTHTFLEVDNASFQQRLMYAMPQTPLAEMRNENNGNDIELQDNNSNRRRFPPLFYRIFTYKDDDEEELVAQ